MFAKPGEWLVVEGVHVDDRRRKGRIVDVRGAGGEPPYLVKWVGDGHLTLFFPGPDTHIEKSLPGHLRPRRREKGRATF